MKIYASTPRQLALPAVIAAVVLILLGIFTILPWPALLVIFLITLANLVLMRRRTWVHVGAAGVAWRTPRRYAWAASTGSVVRDQIRGFSVESQDVSSGSPASTGRVVRLALADGSFVVLPIWESARQPSEQFGRLTRELGKSYSRL